MPESCKNEIDWKHASGILGIPKAQVEYLLFGFNKYESTQYDRESDHEHKYSGRVLLKAQYEFVFLASSNTFIENGSDGN